MDFSLTHLIVVPSANTVPTTGSTQNLVAGKTGIFRHDYSVATAGNIASEPYIYVAQGRAEPSLPSLRSDKIAKAKVKYWTKVSGSASAANEIWQVSNWNVTCGEDVTLYINAHSFYLDTAFFNGLSRSVTVKSPCCACGTAPCTEVDQQALVDSIIAKLNQDFSANRQAVNLATYFSFQRIGTGANSILQISSNPITKYGQPCDMAAFPYLYDRVWFRVIPYLGPETSADFIVSDACSIIANAQVVQRSTYPKLIYDEVYQLEKDYYSYKVDRFKELFRFPGYDPLFESYAESAQVYNQYLIQFDEYDQNDSFNPVSHQDERVILMVPNGISDIETVLTAYLGAPTAVGGTSPTTTTTTSTTSTSTSTTTTLLP